MKGLQSEASFRFMRSLASTGTRTSNKSFIGAGNSHLAKRALHKKHEFLIADDFPRF